MVKNGSPRLIISGEHYQEFEIFPGSNATWMARLLRKAMRKVASNTEHNKKKKLESL